jgi:tRNA modification GTPase
MDTIFAPATAAGRAGVSVVRVSGPGAAMALGVFGIEGVPARRAVLRGLRNEGALIDRALVLTFPEGQSFTGEPVVEFHLHGSPAVVRRVQQVLAGCDGFRPAEAGEFTRRALDNGRLDLTEVEGLADLLAAETEAQRRQAMRVFDGELARVAEDWRRRLLTIVAEVEARIDFADEEVPEALGSWVVGAVQSLRGDIAAEIAQAPAAERVRDGFEVAIVGLPNVGKSTLLNRIARREAALTSEIAGTTRDVIELRYDLFGLPVTFLDTAGLRESGDAVERMGIERALARARHADLRIFLGPAPEGLSPGEGDLCVGAKADVAAAVEDALAVSGLTGVGVDRLLDAVYRRLEGRAAGSGLVIRERQRLGLVSAAEALDEAEDLLRSGAHLELAADRLRAGMRALETLLGRVGVEDILGQIFSSFCIGK